MVDRAWENGASRTHADYHPRSSNGSSQSPRNNWRNNNSSNNNNHRSGDNSSHYTQGNRRPYGQGNYENRNAQRVERPYGNQQGPRSRNFAANTPRSDDFNDERPGYGSQRSYGNNPSFGQRGRQQGNRAPQSHGYGARGQQQQGNRAPQSHGYGARGQQQQGNRAPQSRGYGARGQQQGNFTPGTRGAARHERPELDPRTNPRRNFQPREAVKRPPNPRWLSRPEVRQAREEQRQKEYMQQFEGDYEQFDDDEAPQIHSADERAPRGARPRFEQPEEKHVTRLPNGRVLKGSRPEQRRNAQFWTEIDEGADKLVEQVKTDEDESDQAPSSKPGRSASANRTPRRGAARSKKGQKASNPRSSGPKPSEKGFKWPSQQ
ncbi:hypothetical protein KDH_37280 [Dictyobacter sp. S3.2.2.5]|uniref:Uncharacterized protein n=2 Tax=Dictyobacter halimunensis TaxID=3026934 RepID=A0ABQ6FRJ7_9CHLR|nr:hypothetical protein KDH_37280 [Dictyobacter sp. S3.2.2.5]